MKRFLSLMSLIGFLLIIASGCNLHKNTESEPASSTPASSSQPSTSSGSTPAIDTMTTATHTNDTSNSSEFRGVWLAYTELNQMFSGRSVDQAKSSIDKVMDNVKSYGLNTVFFHVRAKSDAYYNSSIFNPAASVKSLISEGFDPLAYAVEAAHSRGLKLQAWINPYRVGTDSSYAKSSDIFSVSGTYYYNPASLDVQSLILRGVAEIVNNYAVDGIQFDDYFYPTDTSVISPSSPASFESSDYSEYNNQGGTLSVADWRRAQVDTLIAGTYQKAHTRDGCVFGVSPRASVSQDFSQLYADVENWMENPGYLDYVCPQIYFGFENSSSPFDTALAGWIAMKRSQNVQLYIGLGLYKTGWDTDSYAGNGKQEWANHSDIMKRSVQLIRSQKACGGMAFYSYSSFDANSREVSFTENVAAQEIQNLLSVL